MKVFFSVKFWVFMGFGPAFPQILGSSGFLALSRPSWQPPEPVRPPAEAAQAAFSMVFSGFWRFLVVFGWFWWSLVVFYGFLMVRWWFLVGFGRFLVGFLVVFSSF